MIFHEGDLGDGLHLVAQGHVALRIHTPLGDVATVRIVKAGEFFGELAVVSPESRNATAVALDRVETLVLSREQLIELRIAHEDVDAILLDALAAEIRRLAQQVVDLMYVPSERRLWRRLVDLSLAFGTADTPASELPLTQEVVAQLTGCTRETANRALRAGEDEGVIAMSRGRISILDHASLAKKAR